MANPLLDRRSPGDLADRRQTFEIKAKLGDFGRLVEIVETDFAEIPAASRPANWRALPVEIKLEFAWADDRKEIPALSGKLAARMAAVCQRCLQPFEFLVESELNMLMPGSTENFAGSGNFEVWELEEDSIRPLDIIEESLLMALPLAAMHDPVELCELSSADDSHAGSADVARPFAGLRAQMDKSN